MDILFISFGPLNINFGALFQNLGGVSMKKGASVLLVGKIIKFGINYKFWGKFVSILGIAKLKPVVKPLRELRITISRISGV